MQKTISNLKEIVSELCKKELIPESGLRNHEGFDEPDMSEFSKNIRKTSFTGTVSREKYSPGL